MNTNPIHRARVAAGLSQTELAHALDRSPMWVSCAERGVTELSAAMEGKILAAIEKLARFRENVREEQLELAKELRLPSPR